MTQAEYKQQYARYAACCEQRLAQLCDDLFAPESEIGQAARYSLLGGGKRVRGVLTLACCALAGGGEAALDFACALEMVHCHSLIHDDLPCMDDDDLRRGRPSCHKRFGEATALLAGDALLAAAFAVTADARDCPAQSRTAATALLAQRTGCMLYGQELDKYHETHPADAQQLLALHANKTGALIGAAAALGCTAAALDVPQSGVYRALDAYAQAVGLGFQIVDDILDVTASSEQLGKPAGSDAANGKTTFVTLFGLAGAQQMAAEQTDRALAALGDFAEDADFLRLLAQDLLHRGR